jgi:hypothetical protein
VSQCLGVSVTAKVHEAIEATLPSDSDADRVRLRLFGFARRLKAMPELKDHDAAELRPIVQKWHARALPVVGDRSMDDTWADFSRAWRKVAVPHGEGPFEVAVARADREAPPKGAAAMYDSANTIRLLKVCRELQRDAGREPFYLSGEQARDVLGIEDRSAAWRRVQMLETDGWIKTLKKGNQKRATRYVYLHPRSEPDAGE